MDTNDKKVIVTKQDLYWHSIEVYLEGFYILNIYADKEFYRLFNQLKEYVNNKLKFNGSGDIVEQYVITKQSPVDEQEYQNWVKNNKTIEY
ncbi:MAG: hypothetical protein K2M75_06625 [Clostridia bacterium]|nr:hypothetical protein [Clostridia bacterium]